MYSLFSVLILIVCFLLVLIVLVQNSKGGGLASNFSGAGQVMGVRKTADFLEKSTWTLAVALVLFCIVAVAAIPHVQDETNQSRIQEQVQRTTSGVMPTEVPSVPEGTEVPTATEAPAEAAQPAETPSAE
jgi:preprotein translocase, secG subunit